MCVVPISFFFAWSISFLSNNYLSVTDQTITSVWKKPLVHDVSTLAFRGLLFGLWLQWTRKAVRSNYWLFDAILVRIIRNFVHEEWLSNFEVWYFIDNQSLRIGELYIFMKFRYWEQTQIISYSILFFFGSVLWLFSKLYYTLKNVKKD